MTPLRDDQVATIDAMTAKYERESWHGLLSATLWFGAWYSSGWWLCAAAASVAIGAALSLRGLIFWLWIIRVRAER